MSREEDDATPNHEATPRDETYDNFPIEGKSHSDVEWVGTMQGGSGAPHLYEEHTNQIYESEVDEDSGTIIPKNPQSLGDDSLGDYIDRVGQEHGWESLSEFARQHLGADEHDYRHDDEE
jgi:hypothetical protein